MSDEDHARKREEFRGILALSLLAVLLVIRISPEKIIPSQTISVHIPFIQDAIDLYPALIRSIDMIAFFWILYAFLMILRFSDDLISSERLRQFFGDLATVCFILGPIFVSVIFLFALFLIYIVYFFPASLYVFAIAFALFLVIYFILRKYRFRVVVEQRRRYSHF